MNRSASLLILALLAGCEKTGVPASERQTSSVSTAAPVKPIQDNGILDRSQAGLPVPDVAFQDSEGEPVTLPDFKGGPVLLNLWATWCAPCVAEMPTLDALAAREAGRLSVITISQDSDDNGQTAAEKVDAFFNRMKFTQLGAYLDPDSAVMTQLGVSVLPTTILYDAAGKEVWRVTGELNWTGARAAGLLREGGAARR